MAQQIKTIETSYFDKLPTEILHIIVEKMYHKDIIKLKNIKLSEYYRYICDYESPHNLLVAFPTLYNKIIQDIINVKSNGNDPIKYVIWQDHNKKLCFSLNNNSISNIIHQAMKQNIKLGYNIVEWLIYHGKKNTTIEDGKTITTTQDMPTSYIIDGIYEYIFTYDDLDMLTYILNKWYDIKTNFWNMFPLNNDEYSDCSNKWFRNKIHKNTCPKILKFIIDNCKTDIFQKLNGNDITCENKVWIILHNMNEWFMNNSYECIDLYLTYYINDTKSIITPETYIKKYIMLYLINQCKYGKHDNIIKKIINMPYISDNDVRVYMSIIEHDIQSIAHNKHIDAKIVENLHNTLKMIAIERMIPIM